MAKLILTNEVAGLGSAGDVVEVKNGYARNYLIPQGFAVAWTRGGEKQVASIRAAREARAIHDHEEAVALKNNLETNKVRLAVVFRGREITHPQTGMAVLNKVVDLCNDIASVEATPNMEGRRMIMVIAPKPGVVRKAQEAKKAQVAAQMAAEAAKRSGQPVPKAPPPEPEVEDLDEDEINADVEDDEDEE